MSDFKHPIEELIHSTVRIECVLANGAISTGSGYFYIFFESEDKNVPCIVTNKHVIEGAVKGSISLTLAEDNKPLLGQMKNFEIDDFENQCIPHPEEHVDLAIFPIAQLLSQIVNSRY